MRRNNVLGILFANINDDGVHELTGERTLASIPFGGRYRLIDFPISNMVNSGIRKIGIITRNNYQSLMDHVGSGKVWDLSRKSGGLFLLPPFAWNGYGRDSRIESLDSVGKFLKRASNEEYVLMCDCDTICNINYADMISFHKQKEADITVLYREAETPAGLHEVAAYRLDEDGRINEVVIRPESQNNRCYGMGMFLMRREKLLSMIADNISHNRCRFVRDMIQSNLHTLRIYGYPFKEFAAPINSIETYFQANMALLQKPVREALFNPERPIYTKVHDDMPARYGLGAQVQNSMVADGCVIEGEVENSLLFRGVRIGKGSVVKNCIIMQDSVVGSNCCLQYAVIDKNARVTDGRQLMGYETYPLSISKGRIV